MSNLLTSEAMKMLAAAAVEQVTDQMAGMAREMARDLPTEITGSEALLAFASAIEANNAKRYPKKGASQ